MALHSELPIYKIAYDLCDLAVDLVAQYAARCQGCDPEDLRVQEFPA